MHRRRRQEKSSPVHAHIDALQILLGSRWRVACGEYDRLSALALPRILHEQRAARSHELVMVEQLVELGTRVKDTGRVHQQFAARVDYCASHDAHNVHWQQLIIPQRMYALTPYISAMNHIRHNTYKRSKHRKIPYKTL